MDASKLPVPRARTDQKAERPSNPEVLVVLGIVLFVAYELPKVLMPIVLTAAIAFAVEPVVRTLHRRMRLPRVLAVALVFILTIAVIGVVIWWISTSFTASAMQVGKDLPGMLDRLLGEVFGPQIDLFGKTYRIDDIRNAVMGEVTGAFERPNLLLVGETVVGIPATLVMMTVTLFYFMLSGKRLAAGTLRLAPPRYRAHLTELGRQIKPMLRRYIRGVCTVVLYTIAVAYLVLQFIFRIPFAGIIGVLVGMLELIPVVGPATSMVLISASALLAGGSLATLAWALLFAVLLRVSIDEVLGPLVLGRFVALHPVSVIIAFLVAGGLFGVLGVLLAVPSCAAAKIVLRAWYDET